LFQLVLLILNIYIMKAKYNYNSLLLDWLSSLVNYSFIHSFSDNWAKYNIWDGELMVSLDFRQNTHKELFDLLPSKYKGCKQKGTGKLVNEKTLYFKLFDFIDISYPEIESSILIQRHKHQSTEHGWNIVGEYFYTYNWLVSLSDGTDIHYSNQEDKMDMIKGDFIYNARIQERAFKSFLESFK